MQTPKAFCFYRSFDIEPEKSITFDRHYLLYAAKGVIHLSNKSGQWLLPPERAAWIPAKEPITIEIRQAATTCSLLFSPDYLSLPMTTCRVFNVSPLAKQMILHCQQWPAENTKWNEEADHFFSSVAYLSLNLSEQQPAFWLPKGESDAIKKILLWSEEQLDKDITLDQGAKLVHQSVRSLTRNLISEIGLNWRTLRQQQRMVRAMELLISDTMTITDVALTVGYQSQSAFNKAFKKHAGQTPSKFRMLFL